MDNKTDNYVTVGEAAKRLDISVYRIYYLRRTNKIDWIVISQKKGEPYIGFKRKYLVSADDIRKCEIHEQEKYLLKTDSNH